MLGGNVHAFAVMMRSEMRSVIESISNDVRTHALALRAARPLGHTYDSMGPSG